MLNYTQETSKTLRSKLYLIDLYLQNILDLVTGAKCSNVVSTGVALIYSIIILHKASV